jgi:hypothetical protein
MKAETLPDGYFNHSPHCKVGNSQGGQNRIYWYT